MGNFLPPIVASKEFPFFKFNLTPSVDEVDFEDDLDSGVIPKNTTFEQYMSNKRAADSPGET